MSKNIQSPTPQKVDYNDAVAESKVYFDGDDLAATVWVSKSLKFLVSVVQIVVVGLLALFVKHRTVWL